VSRVAVVLLALLACACGKAASVATVEPVSLDDASASNGDAAIGAGDASDGDSTSDVPAIPAAAVGGLWIVDGSGQPVGVLVQRGHPNLASTGSSDILRDGVLVYSPKAGVFFGLQMSTGRVIAPRLGVTDGSCTEPVVAGYFTEGDYTSGQGYAFVFAGKWWRIKDYAPSTFVTCGGTVQDGVDGACQVHSGSCRGFPVQGFTPPLPVKFPAPMAFSWLAGK
jgi:hypothetical protein